MREIDAPSPLFKPLATMTELIARFCRTPPALDGRLSADCWGEAVWSPPFVDMATGAPALYDTRAAVLWDDVALYVGFRLEEPWPRAALVERDSIIFLENDVEVFIDGGDCYYELEVNARNTVYEVFFVWRDAMKRGSRFDRPEFDLLTRDAYGFAGDFDRSGASFWRGTHPRGPRWAFRDWDFPGLVTAVHVDGHLNDPARRSSGWTCEVAFPWAGMGALAGERALPPRPGDAWRLFLGRFQTVAEADRAVQFAWCVTPHGIRDTHRPERFTRVLFER